MSNYELNKLSELERDCLEYARQDFWNEHNFRERAKDLLQDIERVVFWGGNIEKLTEYSEELHGVCSDAERTWKHYSKKALEEFNEYEEEV